MCILRYGNSCCFLAAKCFVLVSMTFHCLLDIIAHLVQQVLALVAVRLVLRTGS